MSRRTLRLSGAFVVIVGLTAALAFERVYDIQIRTRPPDSLVSSTGDPSMQMPLTLRLVDSGGVGIPLDGWGADYSHDRRAFREAILKEAPYVDAAAFQRIEREWHSYVERMREYGNNAISVPMLLELIDFDRVSVRGGSPGDAVYDAASPFRTRHAAVRRSFGPLFEWTERQGMQVFIEADMLTLSAPLAAHLRRVAPDASSLGIDTSNPTVWNVYRAGLEELFERVPAVKGLVIRFGEGGQLYNTAGWRYQSEVGIRSAASLRAMLRGLLPAFEKTGRTLVLRSWTVGVGELGRLHIDPQVYDAVLGDIDSPALVVSTKFTAGDFFSYLPLNPTLRQGRHRRLIELQAKPEFEGFAAFPDFLGDEHASALRALRTANPRIVGSYLFTQSGGPLRAGPRALYPFHGMWLWSDANVFATSRLAADPAADVHELARQWAQRTFATDTRIIDAVTSVLFDGRKAVLDGFYIRPFAAREVRVSRLELPPLMWIFEWDMVGGWHSLLSLVYSGTRDEVRAAITQGQDSAAIVRRMHDRLQSAFAAAATPDCKSCEAAVRSLAYEASLFDVLAAWRQTFLSYYQWLDTGSDEAWTNWRLGREQFLGAARNHDEQFGRDLEFPALDLSSALRAVNQADRGPLASRVATSLVLFFIGLVVLGSSPHASQSRHAATRLARAVATVTVTPWRLDREPINLRTAAMVTALALAMVAFTTGALTGFAVWIEVGSVALCGIVAVAFEVTAPARSERGRLLIASVGPIIPGALLALVSIAYLGPLGVWYRFWTSPMFRVASIVITLVVPLWTACVIVAARARDGWQGTIAGWLTAAGAGILVLITLMPPWTESLRALDRPLNMAPATETMLFALQTYAGVHPELSGSVYVGALLLLAGLLLRLRWQRDTIETHSLGPAR